MRYISKGRVSLLDHGNGPIPCPYCSKKNEKRGSGYKAKNERRTNACCGAFFEWITISVYKSYLNTHLGHDNN